MTVYRTRGTCASEIHVELDGRKIKSVSIIGGCSGNSAGLTSILKGCDADEVIGKLEGIRCGLKSTSCPDQIAKALRKAMAESD